MITDGAFTFDDNTSTEALPAAFLDPIQYVPYEWGAPLPFVGPEAFLPPRTAAGALYDGTPSCWTIIGTTAYIDTTIDDTDNFGGRLMYFALPTALSVSNETNFLTTRYPTLLRHACMFKGAEHMKDAQQAATYMQLAEVALAEAMRTNDMWRRGQYA